MGRRRLAAALAGVAAALAVAAPVPALAQEPAPEGVAPPPGAFPLRVRKRSGFNSGNRLRGSMTAVAAPPEGTVRVVFRLDDRELATVEAPPFEARFRTDDFPPGGHELVAEATGADGAVLVARRRIVLVTEEEERAFLFRVVVPILVSEAVVVVLIVVFVAVRRKKKRRAAPDETDWGAAGGAICPKCRTPFPRHWWAPNLLSSKYDRCPQCRRWSVVAEASREALAAAEETLRARAAGAGPDAARTAEERRARELEDSRFTDD